MTPRLRVLVAYGTRNGSTAEIADAVARVLRHHGLEAHARPARDVDTVDGYDAVVLGGAVYANRWHRDCRRFARRHGEALRTVPVWLFSSGPLDWSADEREIPPVGDAAQVQRMLAARGHVTFGGALRPGARGYLGVARRLARTRGGDYRNVNRIEEWADGVATELRASERVPT